MKMDSTNGRAVVTAVLVFFAIAMMLPVTVSADNVDGEKDATVHVWVEDSAGLGLNNVTVELRLPGGKTGGDTKFTGTTAQYCPIVQNETLGYGDGAEDDFTVAGGGNVMDWAVLDDTVDVNDVLVYVAGTLKTPTTHYTYAVSTGTITMVTAPTSGQLVTATYKWNAGNGHVQFNSVPNGDYVIACEKDDYIPEFRTVNVADDTVHIITMYEWDEIVDAGMSGSPVAVLGIVGGVLTGIAVLSMMVRP